MSGTPPPMRPGDLTQAIWPGLMGADASGPFLVGGRCEACGAISFGLRDICGQCWSSAGMTQVPIGRTGRLYSRTRVHQVPDGFAGPLLVGYVDLPEGLRAFAHLVQGPDEPAMGEEVELTEAPIRTGGDGRALTGPVYRRRLADGGAS